MKEQYKNLGKVSVTPAGTWIRDNEYERLDIVTNSVTNTAYIAKKDVPSGINIDNVEYWQRIGGGSYKSNGLIILADVNPSTGELVQYTLLKAIRSIANSDRQPGLLLGFFGKDNNSTVPNKTTWYLYQYNCDTIEHFEELDYWVSVYYNVNKFRGYFTSEELLQENARYATIGDYAYVGTNMENAILYICNTTGIWSNTQTRAFIFANLYEAVNSKDFSDLDYSIDEQYCDRAEKDSLGRIIHFTYATKEGLNNAITEKVLNILSTSKALPNTVGIDALDESVKQYIGSAGNIVNFPDGEDITVKEVNNIGTLKFADKRYIPTNFSGLGRKYLRKNFVDGINVLEQYMINEPNTIYIIQYDYCLNEEEIEIPENCVLQFEGGSLNGGNIVCNNTQIIGLYCFNSNVEVRGTVKNIDINWYEDDFIALKRCLYLADNNSKVLNITRDLNIDYEETIITNSFIDFQNHTLILNTNNKSNAELIKFTNTKEVNIRDAARKSLIDKFNAKDLTGWDICENCILVLDNKDQSEIQRTANVDYIKIHEFAYIDEYGNRYGDIWNNDIPIENTTIKAYRKINNKIGVINCNLNIIKTEGFTTNYRKEGFSFENCINAIFKNNTIISDNNKTFADKESVITASNVYMLNISDCYIKNNTNKNSGSSYTLALNNIINLTLNNIKSDSLYGSNVWGISGCNYLYNVNITDCQLNRIDIHWRCVNMNVDKCYIGYHCITYTGKGTINITNSYFTNGILAPRSDYGSFFDGNININNCHVCHNSNQRFGLINCVLYSTDFNIRNYDKLYVGGKNINISNITIENKNNVRLLSIASITNIIHSSELNNPTRNDINVPNLTINNVNLLTETECSYYAYYQEGNYINVLNKQFINISNCKNIFINAISDNVYKTYVSLISASGQTHNIELNVDNSNICTGSESNLVHSNFNSCIIESFKGNENLLSEYRFTNCIFKYIKRTITKGNVWISNFGNNIISTINCIFDYDDSYNPYPVLGVYRFQDNILWSIINRNFMQMIGCKPTQALVDIYNQHLSLNLKINNFINIDGKSKGTFHLNDDGSVILSIVKGVTDQRPTNAFVGQSYFDIILKKPIWWTGTAWIDANGKNPDAATAEITE